MFGKEIEFRFEELEPFFAQQLAEELNEEALKLQKIFNFYDEKSELSKLNSARSLVVSEHLRKVISHALKICEQTDGKYDISLGKNFIERKSGKPLSKLSCSFKDVKVNGNNISLNHQDVLIDLGSIAKGYIADVLIESMKSKGLVSGFVDARGDIAFFGKQGMDIAIQHPRERDKIIASFNCKNKAIATSGDYNQFIGTPEQSHIIGKNDFISLTVIAKTLMEADAAATALMVLPEKERINFLKLNKIQFISIDKNLNIENNSKIKLNTNI